MIFYPKSYFNNILEIKVEFLKSINVKAVLLDIDNTVLNTQDIIIQGLEDWIKKLKDNKIKICILSNTNKKKKAEKLSKLLEIPYIYFAKKPLKFGFKRAQKILDIEQTEQIAVIGDQILTDVLGANRSKMYSILVKPLDTKDIFITRLNRKIERKILEKYFKQILNKKHDK